MDDNNLNYLILNRLQALGIKNIDSYYKGTFTSDAIYNIGGQLNLKKTDKGAYFIVNTLSSDSDHSEVGHWLAVSLQFYPIKNMLKCRFFDSFAKKCHAMVDLFPYLLKISNRNVVN